MFPKMLYSINLRVVGRLMNNAYILGKHVQRVKTLKMLGFYRLVFRDAALLDICLVSSGGKSDFGYRGVASDLKESPLSAS